MTRARLSRLRTPRVATRAIQGVAFGLLGIGAAWAQTTAPASKGVQSLTPISVTDTVPAVGGDTLPPAYAGGQVARGGRLGVLGNQDAADVPFSITSYTSTLIENQQARSLADVLKNAPSVQSSYGFGNFAEVFLIRGLQISGEDMSFGGMYGILPRQVLNTQIAERVDLLLGPTAFLNGVPPAGGGLGGTINIEPKRAGDTPLSRFSLDYANDGQVGGTVDLGRRFGANKEFGVRVNALHRDGDTAVDRETQRATFGSVGLDYRGERFRTSIDVGYQRNTFKQARAVTYLSPTLTAVPNAPDNRTNAAQPWSFSDLQTSFGMLRGEFDVNDNWTAYAGVGTSRNRERGAYDSPTVLALDGSASGGRLSVPFRSEGAGGQFGMRGKLRSGPVTHAINAGYSGSYLETRTAYTFGSSFATNIYRPVFVAEPPTIFAGGNFGAPDTRSRARTHGVSVSDTLGFMDERVLLTLGLRRQSIDVQGYDYTGVQDADYAKSVTSPVVGVVFKPWQNLSLYANHIEGLQQGPTAPATAINFGQVFAPFKSKQNEIGAKLDQGNIGGSIALFEIKLPSALTDPATGIFSTNGEQKYRGLEFSVFGEPMRGLRLLGGLTFYDATLSRTAGGLNNGNDAVGVPEYQATASVEWDIPQVAGLSAGGYVIRTGSQYADAANRLQVKPWTRVDLGVRYATRVNGYQIVWRANVENVADKHYWASANGGYLTQGNPRTFKLSATMDF